MTSNSGNLVRMSVPHNGDPALPRRLMNSPFRENIVETYFAGNPLTIPSGRRPKIKHHIKFVESAASFDCRAYDDDIQDLIQFFGACSVRCNLLLNFDGALTSQMMNYIDTLVDSGVSAVTVGSVSLLDQVYRRYRTSIKIQNSVYIPTPDHSAITSLLDGGVTILLVPPDFNHDLEFLHKLAPILSSRGCEFKLMVNEGCVKHCPYRMEDLHDAQSYPVQMAVQDYLNNPEEFRTLSNPCRAHMERFGITKTNYIHPNDIHAYLDLQPLLKIVGRSFSSETILNACAAYTNGDYMGDLRLLVENFKHAAEPIRHQPQSRAVFKRN